MKNEIKQYKSPALKSLHEVMSDLHDVGALDDATKQEFDAGCLKSSKYEGMSVCQLNEQLDYATNYRTVNSRTAASPEQRAAIREIQKAIREAKKREAATP